jgi:phosphohistidine phosphatase
LASAEVAGYGLAASPAVSAAAEASDGPRRRAFLTARDARRAGTRRLTWSLPSAMPQLLLVRHAEAAEHCSRGDLERPLTPQGRADAARMGAYFRTARLIPDHVLVSPARRARDTLEAILRELPQQPGSSEAEDSLYNAGGHALLDLVAGTEGTVETLLIAGHNPGLYELARFLVAGDSALPRHFPAPCLAAIRLCCAGWSEICAGIGRLEQFMSFSRLPAEDTHG